VGGCDFVVADYYLADVIVFPIQFEMRAVPNNSLIFLKIDFTHFIEISKSK
jgi:hypothetical protein